MTIPQEALATAPEQAGSEPQPRAKGQHRVSSGEVFGRWTVGTDAGGTHAMAYRWNCTCTCGSTRAVLEYSLLYGASLSCGCLNTEKVFENRMKAARARYVGKQFGWLTVNEILPAEGTRRGFQFVAICACGATAPKRGVISDLAAGKVSSCCGPAPYTETSQRLLLDVLDQLRKGAPQYQDDHRILKVLAERGAYDPKARMVTAAGAESLASGTLRGYIDALHVPRATRTEAYKRDLVNRTFELGRTVAQVAREAQVAESLLSRWRKQLRGPAAASAPDTEPETVTAQEMA